MNPLYSEFIQAIFRLQSTRELAAVILARLPILIRCDNVLIGYQKRNWEGLSGLVSSGSLSCNPLLDDAFAVENVGAEAYCWTRFDRNRDGLITVLAMRSVSPYAKAERRMMERLRPHLSQAFANAQTIDQCEKQTVGQSRATVVWEDVSPANLDMILSDALGTDRNPASIRVRFRRWFEREWDYLNQGSLRGATEGFRIRLGHQTINLVLERSCRLWDFRLKVQRWDRSAQLLRSPLTLREREVLRWTAEGKTNGEIASVLGMTQGTVKVHLRNVYRKLEVENRTAAVARYRSTLHPPRDVRHLL